MHISYPLPGIGHFLSFGLEQRVLVVLGGTLVQVKQHGIGVPHGGHCACRVSMFDGIIDGDHCSVHWVKATTNIVIQQHFLTERFVNFLALGTCGKALINLHMVIMSQHFEKSSFSSSSSYYILNSFWMLAVVISIYTFFLKYLLWFCQMSKIGQADMSQRNGNTVPPLNQVWGLIMASWQNFTILHLSHPNKISLSVDLAVAFGLLFCCL